MCCDETIWSSMKNNMSEEERNQMWEKMMDCCCTDMTEEEKQKWMKENQSWLQHLKECWGPKMGRMHGRGEKGFMPWDMGKEIMSSIQQSHKIATLATPEVQGLFEDWVEQIEQEMLEYLKDKDSVDIKDLANNFKISQDSAYYFLTRLAQKDKIKLNIKKDKS